MAYTNERTKEFLKDNMPSDEGWFIDKNIQHMRNNNNRDKPSKLLLRDCEKEKVRREVRILTGGRNKSVGNIYALPYLQEYTKG